MPKPRFPQLVVLLLVVLSAVAPVANAQNVTSPASPVNAQMLSQTISAATSKMQYYALWVQSILGPQMQSIFLSIIWIALIAKLIMMGGSIMLGGNIVEQVSRFFIALCILGALYFEIPQNLIQGFRDTWEQGGRQLGFTIVVGTYNINTNINSTSGGLTTNISIPGSNVGLGSNDYEPAAYWSNWLAYASITSNGQTQVVSKFDDQFLANMFGDPNAFKAPLQSQSGGNTGGFINNVLSFMGLTTSFLQSLNPFMAFNYALQAAQVELGAYAAVIFSEVVVLFGAHLVFSLLYCFGLALLPLILFRSFEQMWIHYLHLLLALALLPGLYYIFSGIGYGFATASFQVLMMTQTGSVAQMLEQLFIGLFNTAVSNISVTAVAALDTYTMQIVTYTARYGIVRILGVTIVASFVFMGNAFSVLSVAAASRWNQAFVDLSMMETISNSMLGIQSSIGSTIGLMYSSAANTLGGLGSSISSLTRFGK